MHSILKRIFPELFLNDKAFKTENRYYVSRLKDSLKARAKAEVNLFGLSAMVLKASVLEKSR